jgi:hypothetical protein
MNFKQVFILIGSVLMLSFGLPKAIQKKVDKEIRTAFSIEEFGFNPISISTEVTQTLPSSFGDDNFFEIESNHIRLGYAYIAKAASKTDEFDYLVLLDNDLIILKSKVLAYREDYGGEIGSKRWLKQFIGNTYHDNLRYGDNVMAISGATISVRSMTVAINNLLKSLKILHSENIL